MRAPGLSVDPGVWALHGLQYCACVAAVGGTALSPLCARTLFGQLHGQPGHGQAEVHPLPYA